MTFRKSYLTDFGISMICDSFFFSLQIDGSGKQWFLAASRCQTLLLKEFWKKDPQLINKKVRVILPNVPKKYQPALIAT